MSAMTMVANLEVEPKRPKQEEPDPKVEFSVRATASAAFELIFTLHGDLSLSQASRSEHQHDCDTP